MTQVPIIFNYNVLPSIEITIAQKKRVYKISLTMNTKRSDLFLDLGFLFENLWHLGLTMLPSRKYFKTIYMFVYFYKAQEVELHLFWVSFSTSTSSKQSTSCITIKQNNLKFSIF